MKITAEMVLEKNPCKEWVDRLKNEFAGQEKTLIEILQMDDISPVDRLWVVTSFLDAKTNRLFAVWCAREALKLIDSPDPRSVAACDIAEKYAHGAAAAEELAAAYAAAAAVAGSAAVRAYACACACACAAAAANYARAAGADFARAAGADAAVRAYADAYAYADACACALAADAADAAAALAAQIKKLIEMLEKEGGK